MNINKNHILPHYTRGFTLIEMVIVLVIMWILLLMTTWLSAQQIQKVKDETIKESILSEMQTRYSRNLWSSSFAWKMYDTMEVTLTKWENKIDFKYNTKDEDTENTFTNRFEIIHLGTNYTPPSASSSLEAISLKYTPYKISCVIWDSSENKNLVIIASVNDNRDYCFEINQKNCRLTEMSKDNCDTLIDDAWLD